MNISTNLYNSIQVILFLNFLFQSYCYECFDMECNQVENNNLIGKRLSELPQISRGVREAEKIEDFLEDHVKEPSCSELRRMWRHSREIHKNSIKTNEIPQKVITFKKSLSVIMWEPERTQN